MLLKRAQALLYISTLSNFTEGHFVSVVGQRSIAMETCKQGEMLLITHKLTIDDLYLGGKFASVKLYLVTAGDRNGLS